MSEEEIIEKCKIKKKPLELLHTIAFNIELMGITCFGDEFREIEKALKVLEIIKEYQVDIWLLKQCDYENYIRIRKKAMVSVGQIVNENGIIIEDELPEKYFDLVKRWANE